MEKTSLNVILIALLGAIMGIALALAALTWSSEGLEADEEHGGPGGGVLGWMGQMQTLSHKLSLSLEAENAELAGFYLHELEETVEGLEDDIEEYDGFPVGPMAGSMLAPALESIDDAVDAGDWQRARDRTLEMYGACNACHEATEHGYIRVEHSSTNPYAQDFDSR